MGKREEIHRHIDANLDAHIDHVASWVRQPSASWDMEGVAECAEIVAESYRNLGCSEVEIIDGRFHPGVWAYYDAGSPVTIHSYCMFDTRTVGPGNWSNDPWGGAIVEHGDFGRVIMGRGAMNAKGPYVAFLNALASIIEVEGTLPVNIMFLAEGEELMGSPTYDEFVNRYSDRLKNVQASYCASSTQSNSGTVGLGLGLKGMVVVELTASGEAWGKGPAKTIHSSAGSLVDSPPFRLAQALATLTEPDGTGCAVEGLKELHAQRKPLNEEERTLLEDLAKKYKDSDIRDVLPLGGSGNVPAFDPDLDHFEALVEFLYGPTFNISGLRSGFLGPQTATIPYIIPDSATATLDMRLVIDESPEALVNMIKDHLAEHGFSDIDVDVYSTFKHNQTSMSDPAIQSVIETLDMWGVEKEIWPIQAGGGPWTSVPNAFDVPCIRGGVIGGGQATPVDEFFVIDGNDNVAGLADVEKFHVDLLYNFAKKYGGPGLDG